MDALKMLQSRVSVTKLVNPVPSHTELCEVFKAAARAADHGRLQPWRFLVISGEGLQRLSEVLLAALLSESANVSPAVIEKTKNMPFRAPMIIVAIAKIQENHKVPVQEQVIACGAATQNMLNALFALGFGAVWRTGELAYHQQVKASLGLNGSEAIIGFIYTGSPAEGFAQPPVVVADQLFKQWPDN